MLLKLIFGDLYSLVVYCLMIAVNMGSIKNVANTLVTDK